MMMIGIAWVDMANEYYLGILSIRLCPCCAAQNRPIDFYVTFMRSGPPHPFFQRLTSILHFGAAAGMFECPLADTVLDVAIFNHPPIVRFDTSGQYSGFAIELLQSLASRTFCNISFTALTDPPANGIPPPGFDLSVGPFLATGEVVADANFSIPFLPTSLRLVVSSTPALRPLFSFLDPFAPTLWLLLLAAALLVAFLSSAFDRLSPYGFSSLGDDDPSSASLRFSNSLLNAVMILTGRDGHPGRAWSTRLVLLGFFFLTFVMIALYTASLTAALALHTPWVRPRTVADLQAFIASYRVAVVADSLRFFAAISSKPPLLLPNTTAALRALQARAIDGLLAPHFAAVAAQRDLIDNCATQIVSEGYAPAGYVLVFARGLGEGTMTRVSEEILKMREDGVIDALIGTPPPSSLPDLFLEKFLTPLFDCTTNRSRFLTVSDAWGVFVFLFIFIFAGAIILAIERSVARRASSSHPSRRVTTVHGLFSSGGGVFEFADVDSSAAFRPRKSVSRSVAGRGGGEGEVLSERSSVRFDLSS
jgi:ABC-type amino acid transport substrate-binding protein